MDMANHLGFPKHFDIFLVNSSFTFLTWMILPLIKFLVLHQISNKNIYLLVKPTFILLSFQMHFNIKDVIFFWYVPHHPKNEHY